MARNHRRVFGQWLFWKRRCVGWQRPCPGSPNNTCTRPNRCEVLDGEGPGFAVRRVMPTLCAHTIMQMDLINQLQQTKTETLIFFELGDEDLHKTYAPGKWTIQYILHHMTDAEAVLLDRIRRIISEPRPVILAFDQDA